MFLLYGKILFDFVPPPPLLLLHTEIICGRKFEPHTTSYKRQVYTIHFLDVHNVYYFVFLCILPDFQVFTVMYK
jgi:hypothetical protein